MLPQEVLLAQFSLYVHKGGLKPDSFHFWYATLGPHLFYFKLLGLLAVSLDNGNAGVVWCQLSK